VAECYTFPIREVRRAQGWAAQAAQIDRGVEPDYAFAANWYQQAADQGHEQSQLELGHLYLKGKGVPQDAGQAAHWYTQAANQGNATAAFSLGAMYFDATGVPQDVVEAYRWLTIAVRQADSEEDRQRYSAAQSAAAGRLSASQIADGDRRVEQWAAQLAAHSVP